MLIWDVKKRNVTIKGKKRNVTIKGKKRNVTIKAKKRNKQNVKQKNQH